jgi:hypothetical protein
MGAAGIASTCRGACSLNLGGGRGLVSLLSVFCSGLCCGLLWFDSWTLASACMQLGWSGCDCNSSWQVATGTAGHSHGVSCIRSGSARCHEKGAGDQAM